MIKVFRWSLCVLFFFFVFNGCKKDEEVVTLSPNDSLPLSTEQMFSIQLRTTAGNTPADLVNVFTDNTGRKFTMSDFKYYLSKIVLIKDDNSEISISDSVLLGDVTQHTFPLAIIPVGNYKGFRMIFGLDSVTNHGDPTLYPEGHPLSLQNASMHWGWNFGYIFMKMEGLADTTINNNGTANTNFLYHLGSDKIRRDLDFSASAFTVTSGSDKVLKLKIDLQLLLNTVDFTTDLFTMTPSNMSLSSKIADNWQTAIIVE